MKTALATIAAAIAMSAAASADEAPSPAPDSYANALVRVMCHYQVYDPVAPWQKERPALRYGYGVFVSEELILTAEGLVRNHTLVELTRSREGVKHRATVVTADEKTGLALLKIEDPAGFGEIVALPLADEPRQGSQLEIVQFDETDSIQTGVGRVLDTSVRPIPGSSAQTLFFRVLTDLVINSVSALTLDNGRLAGIVMYYDAKARHAYVLPYPAIRKFIDDAATPPYHGAASAGLLWTSLIDPAKRAFLNAPADGRGFLVISTMPGGGAHGVLQSEDVVVAVDGHAVDGLGFYVDRDFGRVQFSYIIHGRHRPGDTIPVAIVRDKKPLTVDLPLGLSEQWDRLIPENTLKERPPYLVDAGFLIRPLTGAYLQQSQVGQGSPLAHHYLRRNSRDYEKGQQIVILSQVLPHPINVGYQHLGNEVVTRVNNQPVNSMVDVFRIVDADGGLTRLRIHGVGVDIVVSANAREEANRDIARTYGITEMRYERPVNAPGP